MRALAAMAAVFAALAVLISPIASATAVAQESVIPGSGGGGLSKLLTAEQAADFSKDIERDLAARSARVAIVFRTGRTRDQLPDGIDYTHGAFWVYRNIVTDEGENVRGYAVYNLYAGDGEQWDRTESRLVQDWPFDFVAPTAVDDVAIIIPEPEIQRRLLGVIDSETYASLHNPAYSLVANPMEDRYQSCTTFMLDVLAAAAWETTDPAQIRVNLQSWFEPSDVEAGLLMRVFGPWVDPRLRAEDHHGGIRTATYKSMADFLEAYGLLQETYVMRYPAQADGAT